VATGAVVAKKKLDGLTVEPPLGVSTHCTTLNCDVPPAAEVKDGVIELPAPAYSAMA